MNYKTCTKCDTTFEATSENFRPRKERQNKLRTVCRNCEKNKQKEYRSTPQYKAYQKEYHSTYGKIRRTRKDYKNFQRRWQKTYREKINNLEQRKMHALIYSKKRRANIQLNRQQILNEFLEDMKKRKQQ